MERRKKSNFLMSLVVCLIPFLIGFLLIKGEQIDKANLAKGCTTEVEGIVTSLSYEEAQTIPVLNYDTESKQPQWQERVEPAKYYVTISYGDITEVFDDQTLYNTVEVGDHIQMVLRTSYNLDHEVQGVFLELP